MSDDYKVGYGKPPAKTKFQKGKSGNPSGRPKRRNSPNELLDFQKEVIAELKLPMTINEGGKKKKVPRLRVLAKTFVATAFHDKATAKELRNMMREVPKEAFANGEVYTVRVTQSTLDLWEKFEEDVATWSANSSEATNNEADVD
jgi:hypothetical protein